MRSAKPPIGADASTRSPTAKPLRRRAPTSRTTPAISAPGMNGKGGFTWYLPCTIRMSKKLQPAAFTSTPSWPGPTTGSGSSRTPSSAGSIQRSTTTARMRFLRERRMLAWPRKGGTRLSEVPREIDVATIGEDVPLLEAIRTTRAIRRLRPDPVPRALIRKVCEAGTFAPSGGNRQPWIFIAVTDPERRAFVAERYRRAFAATSRRRSRRRRTRRSPTRSGATCSAALHLAEHLHEAPVHLFVAGWLRRGEPQLQALFPAVQNILLACRAVGLGASLTTVHRAFGAEIDALSRPARGSAELRAAPDRLAARPLRSPAAQAGGRVPVLGALRARATPGRRALRLKPPLPGSEATRRMHSLELLAAVSFLATLVAGFAVGGRLLWLARETHRAAESFLGIGGHGARAGRGGRSRRDGAGARRRRRAAYPVEVVALFLHSASASSLSLRHLARLPSRSPLGVLPVRADVGAALRFLDGGDPARPPHQRDGLHELVPSARRVARVRERWGATAALLASPPTAAPPRARARRSLHLPPLRALELRARLHRGDSRDGARHQHREGRARLRVEPRAARAWACSDCFGAWALWFAFLPPRFLSALVRGRARGGGPRRRSRRVAAWSTATRRARADCASTKPRACGSRACTSATASRWPRRSAARPRSRRDALDVDRVGIWLFADERRALRCESLFERGTNTHSERRDAARRRFPRLLPRARGAPRHPRRRGAQRRARRTNSAPRIWSRSASSRCSTRRSSAAAKSSAWSVTSTPRCAQWSDDERDFAAAVADAVARLLEEDALERRRSAAARPGVVFRATRGRWKRWAGSPRASPTTSATC